MAAGSLNGKMRKGKFQYICPPSNTELGRQDEVSPFFPPHEIEEILEAAPPRAGRECRCCRLAQQNWKNLHHLPYSRHLSIGTSSIRIWQSCCFLSFVAGQVFEYWLLAADNGSQ